MKRFAQFVLSLLCGGLVLHFVLRRFDLHQIMGAVRSANPKLLGAGIALMVLGYLVRGARWQIWERDLSYWDSLRLILIGFMGNNILPARLGEVLRAHCAAAKTGDDRGRTAALASIAAERILDGLVLAALGVAGMALVPIDRRLRFSLLFVSVAFGVLALLMVISIYFHEGIRGFLAAINRRFPGHLSRFAEKRASQFLDGLLPLGTLWRMTAAILVTSIIWAIETASYYYIGNSIWGGIHISTALVFLVVVNFASLIPFTIGGIGTIEAVAVAFLVSSGVPHVPALAMILIQHACQYFFTTLTGGILYFAGGFHRIPLTRPKTAVPQRIAPLVSSPLLEETRTSLGHLGETVALKPASRINTQLSIVIPAYNEQARLPRTVLETIRWCTSQDLNFELIISDDGSRDETLSLARLFEESDARVHALACPHMGKGATVRMGILNARGNVVMFMDADGATPLGEIPKLLAAIEQGADVAIGSRVMQRPGEVEIKTSGLRRFTGRVFAFFVNLFAIEGIGDTQCGFKMFRREVVMPIFSRQKMAGFAFDVEILFIARRLSFTIAEIPVNWVAQAGSKVNLVTDSIKMLWDISLIRWSHRNFKAESATAALPEVESARLQATRNR